jgi:hypothetical protein
MFHFFCLHKDEFAARYHLRSNAESTFAMLKAKFGDSVRSKTDGAIVKCCVWTVGLRRRLEL